MTTPYLPSPLNLNVSSGPVAILWDMENCPIPNDMWPDDVVGNIRMALHVHPVIIGPVTMFSAYGDFNLIPRRVREGCQKTGVKLVDIPNGKKEATDKAILVDMFLFALDNRPPSSIVLISGDVDFSPALHILGQRGYMVILVLRSGKPVSSPLCNASGFVWDWHSVSRGEGFLPISEAVFPHVCQPDFAGYSMGCALNDKPEFRNDDKATLYRGIAQGSYNSRSLSLPSRLNEVTARAVSSSNENDVLWARPGDLKGLKAQLVKLLKLSGGYLSLNFVASEYQRMFKRPLTVGEYGASKLVSLMEKVGDVLVIDGQDPNKIVRLRNSKPDLVFPPVIPSRTDKKGKRAEEQNMDANVTAGPISSGNENDKITRRPGDLKGLKARLVKLLKMSGGCLSLSCIPNEYQRMFKRPLTVGEYGASKLVSLMEMLGDVLAIDEQGPDKIVRLRNSMSDPVLPPVILSRTDKKGKGARHQNMGANVTAGLVSSSNEDDEIARRPGDLKGLKARLVKLLKLSGGCLSLNCVPNEYQRMFKRSLTVGEYGAAKLVNLMEMVDDVLAMDEQGPDKIVRLRNSMPDPVLPG